MWTCDLPFHKPQAIPREAKNFELGEAKYYIVLVWSGIIWQFFFLGAIGVIFCASSLLSGIIIAVLLPVTEVLAVIFYQEKFQAEKGVALLLSLWGFVSYFYGELKYSKKKRRAAAEIELPQNQMVAPWTSLVSMHVYYICCSEEDYDLWTNKFPYLVEKWMYYFVQISVSRFGIELLNILSFEIGAI